MGHDYHQSTSRFYLTVLPSNAVRGVFGTQEKHLRLSPNIWTLADLSREIWGGIFPPIECFILVFQHFKARFPSNFEIGVATPHTTHAALT